jgi:hypothetical protein
VCVLGKFKQQCIRCLMREKEQKSMSEFYTNYTVESQSGELFPSTGGKWKKFTGSMANCGAKKKFAIVIVVSSSCR